jgi:protein-arginine deiminase
MSFAPNATNCQQIDSGTYFPQQFAPRGTDNNDGFQKMIDQIVPNSNYIDDWTPLHLYEGEIHCGSNVLRQIPSSNWWNAINAN